MKDKYVKICGIQSLDEAMLCYNAGCTAVGFLMALTHKAEDEIEPGMAQNIVHRMPSNIETVMVTHSLDVEEIARIAKFTGVSAVQIHGDMTESGISQLKALLPGLLFTKTLHVEHNLDAVLTYAERMSSLVDRLLLDSRTSDRLGGTGLVHDWSISKEVVRLINIPVILAGGLNPDNVTRAVEKVNPYGIDVNSGVENTDGQKDANKVQSFITRARSSF